MNAVMDPYRAAARETFGAIATLAMCFALALPVLVLTSFRRSAPRAR